MTLCECGCGGEIIYKPNHEYTGSPKYISGHNRQGTTRFTISTQKEICDKYISGKSSHKLSVEYDASVTKICTILRLNNIHIRTNSENKKGQTAWNKGIPLLKEQAEKLRESNLGRIPWNKDTIGICKPNSGSFKKGIIPHNKIGEGISRLNKLIRGMPEYFDWRSHIFGRDDYTCQHCKIRGVYFEAHHIKELWRIIKEYNMKTIIDARKCNEMWDLNNGITLCKECHDKIDRTRSD